MLAAPLRVPALLLPGLAALWLAGAEGVTLAPWAAVATATVCGAGAAWTLLGLRQRRPGLAWLGALIAWAAVAATSSPVFRPQAAWLVAVGGVAALLSIMASTPAGEVWARRTVLVLAATGATWMVVERGLTSGRPAGPVDDPNRAATVIVLGLALLPGLRSPTWARCTLAALLTAGLVASGSRAAMLAVLVAVAVRVVVASSARMQRLALTMALVAVAGLALRLGLDRDPLRFERVRIWGVAVRTAVAELPFGAGPGGYRDAAVAHNFAREGEFARYHRIPSLAENDALQLAASLGLPGLLAAGGLLLIMARRCRRRPELSGVAAVLATTSTFHSQLWVPLVGWAAVLAVSSAWGREPVSRWRPNVGAMAAAVPLVVATLAAALMWPRGGLFDDGRRRLEPAEAILATTPGDPVGLAGAEAEAWMAAMARRRHPEAWRRLGDVRLRRAAAFADARLAGRALEAYERAAELNPRDVWAVFGIGRSHALLGSGGAARAALRAAVTLEPNCVPAWLELARVELELGELVAARGSLSRAESALRRARDTTFVSAYERAMATPDPNLLAQLRAALGERR